MSVFAVIGLVVGTGCLLAFRALKSHGLGIPRLFGYTLGFGPLIGQGIASLQFFYWLAFGWHAPTVLEFLLLALLLIVGLGWRKGTPATEASDQTAKRRTYWVLLDVLTFGAAAISVVMLCTAFDAINTSWAQGNWDAVAIWNVRARFLYLGYDRFLESLRTIWPATLPHYPLLLPGSLAAQYSMVGVDAQAVPQLTGLVNVFGVGILLFTIVADWGDRAFAAAALTLFWSTLPVWLIGFGQVADMLLAYCLLAAFAVLASQLTGSTLTRLPSVLGGFCLGLLCWSKLEGVPLGVVLIFWFVVIAWTVDRSRGASRKELVRLMVSAVPGVMALLLFRRNWVSHGAVDQYLEGDWAARLVMIERWWTPLRAILERPLPWGAIHGWSWVWTILMAGFALCLSFASWRQSAAVRFWALTVISIVAFWVVTYAVAPYDQTWQLASSLDRLMLQAYPLVIAGVSAGLGAEFHKGRLR